MKIDFKIPSHFEDYISAHNKCPLHPGLSKTCILKWPKLMHKLGHVILYGPPGVGKYTLALVGIHKYSISNLRYDKKLNVECMKVIYIVRMSDVHFEVDMALLGYNAKLLWHEIYTTISEIIASRPNKAGIILCKNFHETNTELLDAFYSYMQSQTTSVIINIIMLVENISFLPSNIVGASKIVAIPKPSKASLIKYNTFLAQNVQSVETSSMSQLPQLPQLPPLPQLPHKATCTKLLGHLLGESQLSFIEIRELLYHILVYNLNAYTCIWHISSTLQTMGYLFKQKKNKKENKKENEDQLNWYDHEERLLAFLAFCTRFNMHYRPIFHLEYFIHDTYCQIRNGKTSFV